MGIKSIFLSIAMLFANLTILSAKIPYLINYQGKLMENGVPVNGSHNIVFRIYDAPTDGTLIWEGDVQTVQITNGLFSAYIGETTAVGSPIAFSNIDWGAGDKYLEIQIDTDTMQPRERLTSVAYALFAKDIEDNSVTSSKIVDGTITDADISGSANISASKLESSVMVAGENISLLNNDAGYIDNIFDHIAIAQGIVNGNGSEIPVPPGFVESQCVWIATPLGLGTGGGASGWETWCRARLVGRKVYCEWKRYDEAPYRSGGTARYIIICVK